jgi:hypothetical protein
MNENFISGSKAQFKNKNCIKRKVLRDSRHLELKSYASQHGLRLAPAFWLLTSAPFVAYTLGVL